MDTHCHLDSERFSGDLSDVIERAIGQGISRWLIAGVGRDRWQRQRALAHRYPGVSWSAGLHPWVSMEQAFDEAFIGQLARCFEGPNAAVAVGEIGLDRARGSKASLKVQVDWFEALLAFAGDVGRPAVLHVARAHGKALDILDNIGVPAAGAVVHGFSGSAETAREYLKRGLFLGVTSGVLRRTAPDALSAYLTIPLDRLLLESDAPDQSPLGRDHRNEPGSIIKLAERLGKARGETPEALLNASTENAIRLFGLD